MQLGSMYGSIQLLTAAWRQCPFNCCLMLHRVLCVTPDKSQHLGWLLQLCAKLGKLRFQLSKMILSCLHRNVTRMLTRDPPYHTLCILVKLTLFC